MSPRLVGFHCVGWIKSAHGISGELYIQLYAKKADWLDEVEDLFLLPKGKSSPADLKKFSENKLKPHKEGLILRSPQIKDRNLAETFKGSMVYISEDNLEAEDDDSIFLKELEGFDVIDKYDKVLGRIEDFASNGAQDLLVVRVSKEKTSLIPLVEDFIVEVDYDREFIRMELPPGLIDLDESQ
jgi:16S rRNA processing protein RimM